MPTNQENNSTPAEEIMESCPFPHEKQSVTVYVADNDERYVLCLICGCQGPPALTHDGAKINWNARSVAESRPSDTPIFDNLDKEHMIRVAIAGMSKSYRSRMPLWGVVKVITTHGSGFSAQLCHELGWNPDAMAIEPLPERKRRTG